MAAGEAAWLAALPCAVVVVLAVVALGPVLGELLFPTSSLAFLPSMRFAVRPEPTEQARYLLALTGPVLLVGATVALAGVTVPLRAATVARLAVLVQVLLAGAVAAMVVVQRRIVYGYDYTLSPDTIRAVWFTVPTLVVAAAVALLLAELPRRVPVRARFDSWTAPTRGREVAAVVAAVALVALTLLPGVHLDRTIAEAHFAVTYHLQFTLDETFAVLNGRPPLIGLAAQYSSLWPYAFAAVMAPVGPSLGAFTVLVTGVGALAMLALFAILRRLTRSGIAALLLFAPLLATTFFMIRGRLEARYSLANLFTTFPLRYAGPFLLAWLLARHLDGAAPRRAWPLFLVAGLVVLNNIDFGVAALGATVAALLWAGGRPSRASLARLALEAVAGLVAAVALVTALTIAVAGSPPDFSLLTRYARMFAVAGFAMIPMQPLGLHIVVYLTFVAAIGVATARAIACAEDRLLTGMLMWSGIFGLGSGAYFVGRSHPEVLTTIFPSWSLSLALLTLVVVRSIAAHPQLRPSVAHLACLLGFGVMVCSLAQTPRPWSEVERLRTHAEPLLAERAWSGFVASQTASDEPVALLMQGGHRAAYELGIEDVTPYTGLESMPTEIQLDETLDALREAGGSKVFVGWSLAADDVVQRLRTAGFRPRASAGEVTLYVRPASPEG